VVIGCGERGCGDQLSVDAVPARRLPVRTAHAYWLKARDRDGWLLDVEPHGSDAKKPWLAALVAVTLTAGDHAIEFSAKHLGGRASLKFTCGPGAAIYVVIDASSNESYWSPALVDWQIDQSDAMPERFL